MPQVTLTRRYSVVPSQAGRLVVPGTAMAWWDVRAGAARRATLPDLTLPVVVGTGSPSSVPVAGAARGTATLPAGPDDDILLEGERRVPPRMWPWLAAGFALLWLITLLWALTRRAGISSGPRARVHAQAGAPTMAPATHTAADLKRALDAGELDDIEDVLRGMARPAAVDLDDLHRRLATASQRGAVELLRRARWAGGDAAQARAALREAFRGGPRWRTADTGDVQEPLPPLYPR